MMRIATYMPPPIAAIVSSTSPSCSGKMSGREGVMVRLRMRRHMPPRYGCDTVGVEEAPLIVAAVESTFGVVVIVVAVLAGIAAIASYIGAGKLYSGIGKSDFVREEDFEAAPGAAPPSPTTDPVAMEELRQLLTAKSDRRIARGETPLDIDAEVAALTAPGPVADDPALREEIRQLVVARNERRARKGEPPLDVDAEVERQIRDLT